MEVTLTPVIVKKKQFPLFANAIKKIVIIIGNKITNKSKDDQKTPKGLTIFL